MTTRYFDIGTALATDVWWWAVSRADQLTTPSFCDASLDRSRLMEDSELRSEEIEVGEGGPDVLLITRFTSPEDEESPRTHGLQVLSRVRGMS
jgi:hypothetical protein